jgi:amidase
MHAGSSRFPYFSARQASRMLANREITSFELTSALISRIAQLDGEINAVVVRDFKRALAAAKEADLALQRGHRAPLLGVPVTVKESFRVEGLPTSWGIPAYRNWISPSESLAIRRLKDAGAVILGKTNVSESLADWQCANRVFGRTQNPWGVEYTSGGSSGGSAASLAAGFSFLEAGSDLAGSIRIPSHFCGVFGHRPSYGLGSALGHTFPGQTASSDLAVVGPLARTADDLMLALKVLAGPGDPESIAFRLDLPGPRHQRLAAFRCLLLDRHPSVTTSAAVVSALHRTADALRQAGVTVATESALLPDLAEMAVLSVRLLIPVALSRLSDQDFEAIRRQTSAFVSTDQSLAAMGLRAGLGSHREWLAANETRARFGLVWKRFFEDWDVILCPAAPTLAYRHDEGPQHLRTLDVDGVRIPYFNQMVWSTLAIPCGLPATVVPVGVDAAGLPAGVQIVGPAYEDATTIAFAEHIERLLGGFSAPPRFQNGPPAT